MTVSTTTNKSAQTGNGVTTLFGFPIPFIAASDLQVYVAGVLKTLTTDYTISGSAPYTAGANVTFVVAPANLAAVLIVRTRPYTQTLDLVPNDPLPADTVEQLLGDHMVMLIQQLKEITDRSFSLPITDTSGASTTIPTPVASQYLGWNSSATALQNYSGTASVPVSAAMTPVVGASTLALARTAMAVAGLADSNTFTGATNTFNNSPLVPNPTGASATQAANISTLYAFAKGFVNKFRNSQMQIATRGASGTITAGSPAYTLDGWIVNSTGANVGWLQQSGSTNYPANYSLTITGAASNTGVTVKQRIESFMAGELAGQRVTVQFFAASTAAGAVTPKLTVNYDNAKDNFGATTAIVNAASLQSLPNTAVGTYLAYTFDMPANAQNGVECILDYNGAILSGQNFYLQLADIRATPGVTTGLNSNPPSIEVRPRSVEDLLCQRYLPYVLSGNGSLASFSFIGQAITTTSALLFYNFAVPARVPVTGVTVVAPTSMRLTNAAGGNAALATAGLDSGNQQSADIIVTVASGLVAGNAVLLYSTTTTCQFIFTGAEL